MLRGHSAGIAVCACVQQLYGARVHESPTCIPTHPLTQLYFCEECYALRCNDCIDWEISSTYCPNCLFEVPGTSVRAQKSQCARNCFTCPVCTHVLSIVGSDPPRREALTAPEASLGVAPFFLSCSCCRWDSKRIGLVAEKAADLSAVFHSMEQNAWPMQEYERLIEHMAPEVQANIYERTRKTRSSRRLRPNLVRPPPSNYHADYEPTRSQALTKYASRLTRQCGLVQRDMMQVSTVQQRWTMPCEQPYQVTALHPRRVRLLCKLSKRCSTCRHILVRPEPRTNSNAYKIKLLASQFLPSCTVMPSANGLWTLTLTNPLMDAMDITLRCVGAELSIRHVQVPAFVDAFEMDDDEVAAGGLAPVTPNTGWDAFVHGTYVYRHHAVLSVRVRAEMQVLPLEIQWSVAETMRSHTFWSLVPLR